MIGQLDYLATPYTRFHAGLDEAARIARANHALLISAGLNVFCPIAHAHDTPLNRLDAMTWKRVNRAVAVGCRSIIILKMPGWDSSDGIAEERGWFREWQRPEILMDLWAVPKSLMSIYA